MGPSFRRTQAKRPYSRRQLLANAAIAASSLAEFEIGHSNLLATMIAPPRARNSSPPGRRSVSSQSPPWLPKLMALHQSL